MYANQILMHSFNLAFKTNIKLSLYKDFVTYSFTSSISTDACIHCFIFNIILGQVPYFLYAFFISNNSNHSRANITKTVYLLWSVDNSYTCICQSVKVNIPHGR